MEQFPLEGFLLPQTPPLKFIMSTKYWDLYVYYVKKCERENYINDIDPHHYKMEWNHFWPKCVFGDWPVGQWLTLRQHAIVSALQTLVFKKNCMCAWHASYIPSKLLALAWPYYCEAASVNAVKGGKAVHAEKDENGKSINAVKTGKALHAEKDEDGLSLFAVEKCGSPRKRTSVIYPDNSVKIFCSLSEASRYLGVKGDNIKNAMKGKPNSKGKLVGLRFELAEEM